MFGIRVVKFAAAVALAVLCLASVASPSNAQVGTVHLRLTKAGFIVGVGGGTGTLSYEGRVYRLSVGGVSLGTIGIASANLVGTARHLRRPEDIAGSYAAASAGFAVVGGPKVARLENANGVILELRGHQVGIAVSLDLSGMTIALR